MENYSVSKTLAISIIILFIGSCIIPTVNSTISKKDTSLYDHQDYISLWTHSDGTKYDNINSFNLWTPDLQAYRTNHNIINYSIKSNNSKYIKKSSIPTSNGKTLYVGGTGPRNYSTIRAAVWLQETATPYTFTKAPIFSGQCCP